jgi:pyruvate kinase
MQPTAATGRIQHALAAIGELLQDIADGEITHAADIAAAAPDMQASARNLAHYLAVRTRELRPLQAELSALSLSSLGRLEGHVRGTVLGVRRALLALLGSGQPYAPDPHAPTGEAFHVGQALDDDDAQDRLERNTARLLGPRPAGRNTRIMVTLPSAAAADAELLRALLLAGMNVARINLAHDDEPRWTTMVTTIRRLASELHRECRILVDLPGPKLRTGPLPDGPRVLRLRPRRNLLGQCVAPAEVEFVPVGVNPTGSAVPVSPELLRHAAAGDELVVLDTRGRERSLQVVSAGPTRCLATTERSVYLGTGCRIELRRGITPLLDGTIGELPPLPSHLLLQAGDEFELCREEAAAASAQVLADGSVHPRRIGCTLPRVFEDVRRGHRICLDDGKITGLVVDNDGERLRVRVQSTPPGGAKLRAEKGINLPDTELDASALTEHDRALFDWVAAHADLVGMSFVQRPADVLQLEAELHRRQRPDIGVMLKIETAIGCQRLPELLFAGLRNPPLGVMVARGDLAVEVGYERLAELQEEILWLCEAAHVPVVWATQVLDGMARTGMPTRAEVTDAAMGGRAECVMLNKGPFVVETAEFLARLLLRMQDHAHKKRSLMRRLRIAGPARTDPPTRTDTSAPA